MRRKQGELIQIERSIIGAASKLLRDCGEGKFHGFQIAKIIADIERSRNLTGYGTLYRALARLEEQGFLTSQWEDLAPSEHDQHRPRRKYYQLTAKAQSMAVCLSSQPADIPKELVAAGATL